MKNHPVLWFYVLAFAVAWLGWLPMVAGSRGIAPFNHPIIPMLLLLPAVGPGLAAIIVMAATEGKASVNRLLKPLVQWRVGARLLVIAVVTAQPPCHCERFLRSNPQIRSVEIASSAQNASSQ